MTQATQRRRAAGAASLLALSTWAFAALPAGIAAAQQAPASPAAPAAGAAAPRAPEGIARRITLAELGYDRGLVMTGLRGRQDLYFPVPDGGALEDLRLKLTLETGAARPVDRYLMVSAGDLPLRTLALPTEEDSLELDLRIPAARISQGFVKIGLAYSGSQPDLTCQDGRAAGDYLSVLPGSGLDLDIRRDALSDLATLRRTMPGRLDVVLGEGVLTLPAQELLLRAGARAGGESGGVSVAGTPDEAVRGWRSTTVLLDPNRKAPGMAATGSAFGAVPALVVGPGEAGSFLTRAAGPAAAPAPAETDDFISFQALGAGFGPRDLSDSTDFQLAFDSADLPGRRRPERIELGIAAAPDAQGEGTVLSVFLNDTLLGSAALPSGAPTTLRFPVPAGLTGSINQLRLRVQRPPKGGACMAAEQGYPVQILPGSGLRLAAGGPVDEFWEVRRAAAGGIGLLVAPELRDAPTTADWLVELGGALVPDAAPVTAVDSAADLPADRPFLLLGPALPEGITPVAGAGGEAQPGRATLRVVHRGEQPGIWVATAGAAAPEVSADRPLRLAHGAAATLGAAGPRLLSAPEVQPMSQVSFVSSNDWRSLAARYRPWVVGAVWLGLTFLMIAVVRRVYRRKRPADKG